VDAILDKSTKEIVTACEEYLMEYEKGNKKYLLNSAQKKC
jgi:hypothetical protein